MMEEPNPASPPLNPASPQPIAATPLTSIASPLTSPASPQPNPASKKKKRKTVAPLTGKRQPWTIADNELLTKGFLHVSNECIVENAQRSSDFWKRVLQYYMEGDRSGTVRTADNLRSHWHMIKNNVASFNNIMIQLRAQKGSGWSDDQLKTHAHTVYFEEHNTHFIHEHVWNLVKDEPKWKKQIDIQSKRTKTSGSREHTTSSNACNNLNDDVDSIPLSVGDDKVDKLPRPIDVDNIPLLVGDDEVDELSRPVDVDNIPLSVGDDEVDDLPRPVDAKMAKANRSSKGKGVDVATKLDNMLHKKVDMIEQFNAKMTKLLELKEKKLDMEILYKDTSQMDPETLAFHKEQCAMIREKYGKKK